MLASVPTTIPAEIRDFPEWHFGRETYSVWILSMEKESLQTKFEAARQHLSGYLLEPYDRQPHITLFVCGFLVGQPLYGDDFTRAQAQTQIEAVENAGIQPFEIEIRGLNSFASAPYLEVDDLQGGVAHLREILSRGAREIRTAPYTPHLTVGLYAGAFPSNEVAEHMRVFPVDPVRLRVERITFATYRAQEIAGLLAYQDEVLFTSKR